MGGVFECICEERVMSTVGLPLHRASMGPQRHLDLLVQVRCQGVVSSFLGQTPPPTVPFGMRVG